MGSPFPGMDPYLENPAHWPDFHATFINHCREALRAALPQHYTARIGERVYLIQGPPGGNGSSRRTLRSSVSPGLRPPHRRRPQAARRPSCPLP
jgi:hypothetical protein